MFYFLFACSENPGRKVWRKVGEEGGVGGPRVCSCWLRSGNIIESLFLLRPPWKCYISGILKNSNTQ